MRASWAALLAGLFVACGDSGEENPMPSQIVELDELCEVLAQAECDRLGKCGALAPPIDAAACRRRERELRCARMESEARRLIAASEIEIDREAAARCRDAIGSTECGLGLRDVFRSGVACQQIWRPKAIEGAPCSSSYSCTEGLVCLMGDACPGTCRAALQTNQPCDFDSVCDDQNFCSLTAMRCRERVARGQTCEAALSGNSCEEGSWCDLGQLGGPVCTAAGGRGFACDSAFQCAAGARCIGGSCSAGLENDRCEQESHCTDGLVCAAGRCRAPILVGGACTPEDAACAEGSVCQGEEGATSCEGLAALSAACREDRDCYLARCVGGRCIAHTLDGEACETNAECLPGRTCDASVCKVTDTCFL